MRYPTSPALQGAQGRGLLEDVIVHAPHQTVEKRDRLDHRRPLVQHHAFGPRRHGGISHLATCWNALLDHVLQHLCRPDAGDGGRLADPEDLLLHLSEPFKADFSSEIATCDHHTERPALACPRDQGRKIGERERLLDLGDQAELPIRSAVAGEDVVEQIDVFRSTDKGVTDQIGAFDDHLKVGFVLAGQRRKPERGVGKVDALFGLQACAAGSGTPNDDDRLLRCDAFDNRFELSVIVPEPITDGEPGDHFREGDRSRVRGFLIDTRSSICDEADAITDLQPRLLVDRCHLAGPDLRAGNVHQNLDVTSADAGGLPDESGHGAPGLRIVMGAIDAGDIHAGPGEVQCEVRTFGGLTGQRHHDPRPAAGRRCAEKGNG